MNTLLLVCAGGALGAGARHLVNGWALRLFGGGFPVSTLLVNIVGSFLMGVLVATLLARAPLASDLRAFLTTGILGGFTTFSAFALETVVLVERQALGLAGVYVIASVAGSVIACFAGLALAREVLA